MYTSERISANTYHDFKKLFRLSFGTEIPMQRIRAKFDTSAFGAQDAGMLARDEEGEPAAYYGVFPVTIFYAGKDVLAAQSGDTMTAPAHRKQGLFVRLAEETYALARELGIRMVFGFPNENSYPGFKNKLEWIFTGYMQRFHFSVSTIPLCEASAKIRIIKPLYDRFASLRIRKYALSFGEIPYDAFNAMEVKGYVKKDPTFFAYKLRDASLHVIRAGGFYILLKADTHLRIGAVAKFERARTAEFLAVIRKLAKRMLCRKVEISLSTNHWLFPLLQEHLEPVQSLPIGFYIIDKEIGPGEFAFSGGDFDTF